MGSYAQSVIEQTRAALADRSHACVAQYRLLSGVHGWTPCPSSYRPPRQCQLRAPLVEAVGLASPVVAAA